jgi:mRNA interferase MazF
VSNDRRDAALLSVLAVRITTSTKPSIPSVVPLLTVDPIVGRVLCDEITEVYADEIEADAGAVSPTTTRRVETGLKAALELP